MYKELERMWWGTVSGLRLKEVRKVIKYQVGLPSFRYDIYIYIYIYIYTYTHTHTHTHNRNA